MASFSNINGFGFNTGFPTNNLFSAPSTNNADIFFANRANSPFQAQQLAGSGLLASQQLGGLWNNLLTTTPFPGQPSFAPGWGFSNGQPNFMSGNGFFPQQPSFLSGNGFFPQQPSFMSGNGFFPGQPSFLSGAGFFPQQPSFLSGNGFFPQQPSFMGGNGFFPGQPRFFPF